MIEGLILVFGALHILAFVGLTWVFHRISCSVQSTDHHQPFFSVVIPVRNEESNILFLLQDLEEQDYGGDFEVIVVDDASEDDTWNQLQQFKAQFPLRFYRLPEGAKGKKAAISLAVEKATGDWVLTTDGDCRVPRTWLKSFARQITDQSLMIVGPVRMQYSNLFGAIQSFDFSILIGYAASLVKLGVPSMSNGANLAYRRWLFQEVGGYEGNDHVPSGDDEFLLLKVHRKYGKGIQFNADRNSAVSTRPKSNFHALLNQRKRWLSKWTLHKSGKIILSVILILLDNLAVIFALIAMVLGWIPWYFLGVLLIRLVAKGGFAWRVNQAFDGHLSWIAVVLYEFIYPFYVVLLSLASIFGHYTWKGRRYT
jgi:cellulose synthase/poly-beta-1,6-N-acetylglucosamine synthase-like glycosyltransferase